MHKIKSDVRRQEKDSKLIRYVLKGLNVVLSCIGGDLMWQLGMRQLFFKTDFENLIFVQYILMVTLYNSSTLLPLTKFKPRLST